MTTKEIELELEVIQKCYDLLTTLSWESSLRALNWLAEKLAEDAKKNKNNLRIAIEATTSLEHDGGKAAREALGAVT